MDLGLGRKAETVWGEVKLIAQIPARRAIENSIIYKLVD